LLSFICNSNKGKFTEAITLPLISKTSEFWLLWEKWVRFYSFQISIPKSTSFAVKLFLLAFFRTPLITF